MLNSIDQSATITAPDFELTDTNGNIIRLSDYRNRQPVVLVLTRGFVWPFCRRHLAQLRLDYQRFLDRQAEIIILGPDGPNAFKKYWQENELPFPGCADIKSRVADQFHQEVNFFKMGRMPAVFVIDQQGLIRYSHYGESMSDIPLNDELLSVIDGLA